jgi:hypothetical protein
MHKHDEEHGGRDEDAEDNHETPEGWAHRHHRL